MPKIVKHSQLDARKRPDLSYWNEKKPVKSLVMATGRLLLLVC